MSGQGWIGVDLDGTLAYWGPGHNETVHAIGLPIPPMVDRVKAWIAEGREVRIVTARVGQCGLSSHEGCDDAAVAQYQRGLITDWLMAVFGLPLPITCQKDFLMVELWDDRCVQVVPNTGQPLAQLHAEALRRAWDYEGV